eukprot:6079851-Amphidinium_carterae.1
MIRESTSSPNFFRKAARCAVNTSTPSVPAPHAGDSPQPENSFSPARSVSSMRRHGLDCQTTLTFVNQQDLCLDVSAGDCTRLLQ